MVKRLTLTAITLVFVLFFFGCKKAADGTETKNTYYIPEDFKLWVVYKPGTWWIYLNEKTGVQDCTFVNEVKSGMSGFIKNPPVHNNEWITVFMSGNLFSGMYTEATDTYPDLFPENADLHIQTRASDIGDAYFSYYLLKYPGFDLHRFQEEIYNIGVKTVYPEDTINGAIFTNVYDLRHEWLTPLGDSLVTEAHLVKNIGIVKFRIFRDSGDTTWSLLRWKVIQ